MKVAAAIILETNNERNLAKEGSLTKLSPLIESAVFSDDLLLHAQLIADSEPTVVAPYGIGQTLLSQICTSTRTATVVCSNANLEKAWMPRGELGRV